MAREARRPGVPGQNQLASQTRASNECRNGRSPTPPLWLRLIRSTGVQLVVAAGVLGGVFWYMLHTSGGVAGLHEQFGFYAMGLLVSIQAVVAVSPFPGELVALGNSMIYGFWIGTACNWSGWMLAAVMQYYLSKRTADDLAFNIRSRRMPRWLRRFPATHPLFLVVGRWMPFGSHVVNTAAGVYGVPMRRYLACAAVGILPVAVMVAAAAYGLMHW